MLTHTQHHSITACCVHSFEAALPGSGAGPRDGGRGKRDGESGGANAAHEDSDAATPTEPNPHPVESEATRRDGRGAEGGGAARQGIGEGGAVERDDSERDAGEGDTGERDADPARNKKQPHVSEKAQAQLVRLCSGFGASRFGVELSSFRHAQVARIAWWC